MNIHIELDDKSYPVETFGGKYKDTDCEFDSFGIQIEGFSMCITSETARNLIKKLTEHLEINNIKV